jgi:hypothetical protein
MKTSRLFLFILLIFSTIQLIGQSKWSYDFGLGTSLNIGNVNNCNINNYASINRNDSLLAFDFHYKLLYSSLIDKNDMAQKWKETNFEINGGVKLDYLQYGQFSPFLACEMLTNKYKGYDIKISGLVGVKYRIYVKPSICDYSISAAFVYDRTDFTDATTLPYNNFRISIRPKIKQKLAENLTLLNLTYFQPSILDLSDYIINTATKLQTKLTKKLFIDLSFTYEYRSRVPSDKYKKHDFLSEVSLRLKF